MQLLTKKNIIISVILVALMAFISLFFLGHKKTVTTPEKITLVKLSVVKIAMVPVVIHATGDLLASRQVEVTPETAGYVSQILFNEGSFVNKGATLVQLDNRQQQDKVAQAQAVYDLSNKNYDRNLQLKQNLFISPQDLDQLKSTVEQNRAALQTAKTVLDQMTLRAPFSGYVGEKSISVGDYIQPGTQVVTLTDTKHLKISYNVPARFANDIKLGQAVDVSSSSMPTKLFVGKVSYISPTVNEDNQTLTVHAELTNAENMLKPGEFVSLKETLSQINNAILVPENAVLGNINGYYVLQVKNNKTVSTPVTPGKHYNGDVLILSGLKPDDKIITAGQSQVKIGDRVKISGSDPKGV